MVRTLLTGATGTLGTALRPRLAEAGHDVLAASRDPPDAPADGVEWVSLDIVDGTGVDEAMATADIVVHAATAPQGDTEAVDVEGTRTLLDAAARSDIENFLYVSIVGVDEIPFSYYDAKFSAEQAVEESDVPSTIVRSTQFHSFVDETLGSLAWLPVWPLPTAIRVQPIDVGEAADAIVDHAMPDAGGRVEPVGGPDVLTVREIATSYRQARELRRPIIRLPIPGATAGAFRDGKALCPDSDVGTLGWEQWLDGQYGSDSSSPTESTPSPT